MSNHSNMNFSDSNWIPGAWGKSKYYKLDFGIIATDRNTNTAYAFRDNGTFPANIFVDPAKEGFLSFHNFDKLQTYFLPLWNTQVRKLQNPTTKKMLYEFAVTYIIIAPNKTRHIMVIKWQTPFIEGKAPYFAFYKDHYFHYSYEIPDSIKANKKEIEKFAYAAMLLTEQDRVILDQEIAEQENKSKRAEFINMLLTPEYKREEAAEKEAIEKNPASYIENAFSSQSPSQFEDGNR